MPLFYYTYSTRNSGAAALALAEIKLHQAAEACFCIPRRYDAKVSALPGGPVVKKREHRNDAPAFSLMRVSLLNGDFPLHVQREVRRAVEGVFAGLDVRERDGDGLSGIRLHRTRELSHLLRSHVRVELRL